VWRAEWAGREKKSAMSKLEIEGIGVWECGVGGEVRLYRRPSVCPSRARPAQSSIDRPCKVERTGHSRLRLARVAGVSHWLPRRLLPSLVVSVGGWLARVHAREPLSPISRAPTVAGRC